MVERKALRLVCQGPGKAGDVRNRIISRDVSPGFSELRVEYAIKPRRLIAIAFDGVGDLLRRVECEMTVLAEHGTEPAHLPHQPLHDFGAGAQFIWEKAAGLVGEVNQDGAGLEYRKRLTAIGGRAVNDRRNPIVRADRQKIRLELFAGPDVDGDDRVGNPEFFQHDRNFPAVRRRRVIEIDHGISVILVGPP